MIELFKKCPYIKTLDYDFGEAGFLDGFFVLEICKSLSVIEEHVSELNQPVVDKDTLYTFLWSKLFINFSSNLGILKISDTEKEQIKKISNLLKPNVKSFVNFINDNIQTLINDTFEDNHVGIIALKTAFNEYLNSLNESTIDTTISKYSIYVLAEYSHFEKYFSKHQDKIPFLFNDIKKTRLFDESIYTDFLLRRKEINPIFKDKAEYICERALPFFESIDESGSQKDLFDILQFFNNYFGLAYKYKLKVYDRYVRTKEKLSKALDNFIHNYGQKVEIGPINLKKTVIDTLSAMKQWSKFIALSHTTHTDGTFKNTFDSVINLQQKDPLSELGEDFNRPANSRFPLYKQNYMEFHLGQYGLALAYIYNDEQLKKQLIEYVNQMTFNINTILGGSLEIQDEITGIFDAVNSYVDLARNKNEFSTYGKFLLRSISVSSILSIEKVVRTIAYIELKDSAYFDEERETLTSLLKNHELKNISNGLKYFLEFFLIKDTKSQDMPYKIPGKNLRNSLIHSHSNIFNNLTYKTAIELVYLLLNLLNDLYLHIGYKVKK